MGAWRVGSVKEVEKQSLSLGQKDSFQGFSSKTTANAVVWSHEITQPTERAPGLEINLGIMVGDGADEV